jgi:hypothetical protein
MTCNQPPCGIFSVSGCNPTCECAQDLCNLPNPYVVDADASQECHTSTVIQQLYVTGLSTKAEVSIPACSGTFVISINGIHSVILGSYLWNPDYGHFKVISFDYATEQITLENECQDDNAAPGTNIPACTLFLAVDTPCCDEAVGGALYYPYLAVDFTVPAIGNCLDITVTSIVGLSTGMEVQIGTGVYSISSIVDTDRINICNDGSGATSGTVVEAKDAYDNYITPIISVGVALCGGSSDPQGALVVCADGNPTTLSGDTLGYIPALINTTTNEVEFQDPATLFSIDPCAWDLSDRVYHANISEVGAEGSFTLNPPGDSTQATTADIVIENDTCEDAEVMLGISGFTDGGNFNAASGEYGAIVTTIDYATDSGAIGTTSSPTLANDQTACKEVAFNRTSTGINHDFRMDVMKVHTISAGDELRVKARFGVAFSAGTVTDYSGDFLFCKVVGRVLAV